MCISYRNQSPPPSPLVKGWSGGWFFKIYGKSGGSTFNIKIEGGGGSCFLKGVSLIFILTNHFQFYLSVSVWCSCVKVVLNIFNRYVTSTSEQFLKERHCGTRPPRFHKIFSSVRSLWKKSLNLGKVIKNFSWKISFIHFSGKENCSIWTVLHCSFEEVGVKCRPQTPEHCDIVTVLIHNYYYLQTVNTTSDCTLGFVEFGLWLAPKANQGRRGPTIIITLTRYWNIFVCLLLSYLVWILILIIDCNNNSNWSRYAWHLQILKGLGEGLPLGIFRANRSSISLLPDLFEVLLNQQ